MGENDEKTLAEVEAEYKKLLEKKVSQMKAEAEEKEKLAAKQEAEEKQKQEELERREWLASELKKFGINQASDDLDEPSGERMPDGNKETPEHVAFAQSFLKSEKIDIPLQSYEKVANNYLVSGSDIFAATNSDDGCDDDVTAWEVNDCFASAIWMDVICKSNFAGRITVRGLDFKQGCGGKVQIRTVNVPSPSSDFGAMSPCECLSCVSNTFSTYTLTMETYGDYRVLCDLDLFTAGNDVKSAVIRSMSARAAERIDNKIYTELEGASAGHTAILAADCGGSRGTDGDCCTFTVDLYDKIIDLEAEMRAAGYFQEKDPILIVSPSVAAYLKYKDGLNMPSYIASQVRMDGLKLAGIGNIQIIESCHANSCTDAADEVIAILIDPERAIGEAWGKKPSFKTDDDPIECGSQKVVLRMWADFAALDVNAIGHIQNPS